MGPWVRFGLLRRTPGGKTLGMFFFLCGFSIPITHSPSNGTAELCPVSNDTVRNRVLRTIKETQATVAKREAAKQGSGDKGEDAPPPSSDQAKLVRWCL